MKIMKYGKLDEFKKSIKYFCLLLTGGRKCTHFGVAFVLKLNTE